MAGHHRQLVPGNGHDGNHWYCIDQQGPQDSGQDGMLVNPGFKSTKFFAGLLDGGRVFQAGVKELPQTLDRLLRDGWNDSS